MENADPVRIDDAVHCKVDQNKGESKRLNVKTEHNSSCADPGDAGVGLVYSLSTIDSVAEAKLKLLNHVKQSLLFCPSTMELTIDAGN